MVTESSNTANKPDYNDVRFESDIVEAPYKANNVANITPYKNDII